MKKYYKVVRNNKSITDNAYTTYALGGTYRPTISHSKFFVFDDYNAAAAFAYNWFNTSIYECSVVNPRKPNNYINLGAGYLFADYVDYWALIQQARKQKKNISKVLEKTYKYLPTIDFPPHTIWCDAVTLTKKIL